MTEPVSPAELDYIAWAHARGDTMAAIARHLDRNVATIVKRAKKLGLSRKKAASKPTKLSEPDQAKLRELVPQIGIARTAILLEVSQQLISRWARRLGVESPWKWNTAKERTTP